MKKILFIGNGLNLVSDNGASWNNLLNKLAGTVSTKHEEDVRNAKPFTLWFEEIKNRLNNKNLKKVVSGSSLNELPVNKLHIDIMKLDFEHFLTTNYDYCLGKATGEKWRLSQPAAERSFSLFRRHTYENRHIWHIHGELRNSNSIMLGHGQYSGYFHKIRNFITSGVSTDVKARKGRAYLSKFSTKNVKTKGDVETWVDLFLEHEVHMIGFSFDYTENHLWNLLMEKKKLQGKELNKTIGNIVFHRCSNKLQTVEEEAKLMILSSFGVDVKEHIYDSYLEAYSACINSFSSLAKQ